MDFNTKETNVSSMIAENRLAAARAALEQAQQTVTSDMNQIANDQATLQSDQQALSDAQLEYDEAVRAVKDESRRLAELVT